MRIIVQEKTGAPEVLQVVERPVPQPGPGEVLVKVAAAGINPVDGAVSAGYFPLLGAPPFTVGWDIAGEVVSTGPGAVRFKPGDRVFGMPRFPGQAAAYAEYAVAPEAELAATPKAWSDVEAGAMPLAGLTAWQALVSMGGLKAGQRVLVHGGAGGVGHLAVQIAKALGAEVTATASAGKLEAVRGFGADMVIDYAKGGLEAVARSGFDLVLDPQAGEQAVFSVSLTRPGGRVLCLLDPNEEAKTSGAARGVDVIRIGVRPDGAGLAALAELAEAGKLRPVVAAQFPLEQVAQAYAALAARPVGKVVLRP